MTDAQAYADYVLANHEPWEWPWDQIKRRRKRRRRRFSMARAITYARKTGADLVVAPDGTITLRFGERESTTTTGNGLDAANPWDRVT